MLNCVFKTNQAILSQNAGKSEVMKGFNINSMRHYQWIDYYLYWIRLFNKIIDSYIISEDRPNFLFPFMTWEIFFIRRVILNFGFSQEGQAGLMSNYLCTTKLCKSIWTLMGRTNRDCPNKQTSLFNPYNPKSSMLPFTSQIHSKLSPHPFRFTYPSSINLNSSQEAS